MLQTEQTAPKQLQLEERQCLQCSRSFRVLITSPQSFCSKPCQEDSPIKSPKPKKVKPWASLERDKLLYGAGQRTLPSSPKVDRRDIPKPKPPTIEAGTIIHPEPEPEPTIIPPIHVPPPVPSPQDQWEEYVSQAKTHVRVMNQGRMAVAELAIKACDIVWGGGNHWKGFEGVYTLTKFAEEIGVHYKTLSQWCAVKRLVKDKLPDGVWVDDDYTAALRTQNKIDRNSAPKKVEETYRAELNRDRDSLNFVKSLAKLKSTRHLVCDKVKLETLDRGELMKMRDLAAEIEKTLTDFLTRTNS